MTNPPRNEREQIALMLGWKPAGDDPRWGYPYRGSGLWIKPNTPPSSFEDRDHSSVVKLPPFTTDDGTALGALEEWCRKNDCWYSHSYYPWHYEHYIRLANRAEIDDPDDGWSTEGRHKSLARAICDAMRAAHKEITK